MTEKILDAETLAKWNIEFDEIAAKQAGVTPENMSTLDRLMRRIAVSTTDVAIDDGNGGIITLKVRDKIPDAMLNDILKMQARARTVGFETPEEEQKASDKMSEFLAFVCTDPAMDKNFWSQGKAYSTDVVVAILNAILESQRQAVEKAQSFRKK